MTPSSSASNTLGLQFTDSGEDADARHAQELSNGGETITETLLDADDVRRRVSGSSRNSSHRSSPQPPRGRLPRSQPPYRNSPSSGFVLLDDEIRRRGHEQTIEPQGGIPKVLPPVHQHRTLVLLFDGTGDQFDADNSNIVQLMATLHKDDRTKQMVYYQAGLGTYTAPQVVGPIKSQVVKTLDLMLALTLDAHVMNGYEFLMQNYMPNDKICLFGFSRGAYTARSLAGMIHKVGLLPPDNWQQVPFAYKMYSRVSRNGWAQSNAFKRAFCRNVEIEFIGVWDTVNSVGLIPRRLPFTVSNTIVHTFRHALALDERRVRFQANMWTRPDAEEETDLTTIGIPPPSRKNSRPPLRNDTKIIVTDGDHNSDSPKMAAVRESLEKVKQRLSGSQERSPPKQELNLMEMEAEFATDATHPTDVLEVWFSGCHADVGGGSVRNETRHALSRIPLRWMIRECMKTNTGIMFNTEKLQDLGMDPYSLYPIVTPVAPRLPAVNSMSVAKVPEKATRRSWKEKLMSKLTGNPVVLSTQAEFFEQITPIGSEAEEEHKDALAPRYDQLKLAPIWWLLEVLPMEVRTHFAQSWPITRIGFNVGNPRVIPKPDPGHGFMVHRSVKTRMEAPPDPKTGKVYRPRAHFPTDPTWVDDHDGLPAMSSRHDMRSSSTGHHSARSRKAS